MPAPPSTTTGGRRAGAGLGTGAGPRWGPGPGTATRRGDPARRGDPVLRGGPSRGCPWRADARGGPWRRPGRAPRLIRRSDPETYAVGLILRGRQTIVQNRREAPLGAGDLVVYSTSPPTRRSCGPSGRRRPPSSCRCPAP
ncbi:hypothetical protein GTY84_30500 [Streptomyces sp. SID8352]|nr:hypothetical protein [Streptomyces sp. SID8352]